MRRRFSCTCLYKSNGDIQLIKDEPDRYRSHHSEAVDHPSACDKGREIIAPTFIPGRKKDKGEGGGGEEKYEKTEFL